MWTGRDSRYRPRCRRRGRCWGGAAYACLGTTATVRLYKEGARFCLAAQAGYDNVSGSAGGQRGGGGDSSVSTISEHSNPLSLRRKGIRRAHLLPFCALQVATVEADEYHVERDVQILLLTKRSRQCFRDVRAATSGRYTYRLRNARARRPRPGCWRMCGWHRFYVDLLMVT